MPKITLWYIHSTFLNVPDWWSTESRFAIDTNGDYAKTFILPDGYSVSESVLGERLVYSPRGSHCEIVMHRCGFPQLIWGNRDDCPVLLAEAAGASWMAPENIMAWRKVAGISQAQAAAILDIGASTLQKYESGIRPVPKTAALAIAAVRAGLLLP